MPRYRLPEGEAGPNDFVHLNFGSRGNRDAPPPCNERRTDGTVCFCITQYQCDWKLTPPGQVTHVRTCDRYLCAGHAFQVAPNKHLCPEHKKAYEAWLERRPARPVDLAAPVQCATETRKEEMP